MPRTDFEQCASLFTQTAEELNRYKRRKTQVSCRLRAKPLHSVQQEINQYITQSVHKRHRNGYICLLKSQIKKHGQHFKESINQRPMLREEGSGYQQVKSRNFNATLPPKLYTSKGQGLTACIHLNNRNEALTQAPLCQGRDLLSTCDLTFFSSPTDRRDASEGVFFHEGVDRCAPLPLSRCAYSDGVHPVLVVAASQTKQPRQLQTTYIFHCPHHSGWQSIHNEQQYTVPAHRITENVTPFPVQLGPLQESS